MAQGGCQRVPVIPRANLGHSPWWMQHPSLAVVSKPVSWSTPSNAHTKINHADDDEATADAGRLIAVSAI